MPRKLPGLGGLGAAMLVVAFGCQGSGSFAQFQETLSAIAQKQDDILRKLDELESKVGTAAPAARDRRADQPQAGRPHPAATYKVAVGDAHFKGPADAKVTIVEWSDFQ